MILILYQFMSLLLIILIFLSFIFYFLFIISFSIKYLDSCDNSKCCIWYYINIIMVTFYLLVLSLIILIFILISFYSIYYLTIISILLIFFQCYILYSEQYFSLTIDMIHNALQLISVWKKVPLCSLLYYLLITAGYSITMVSIKLFITVSMMIGNIIDIYLSGIMIVLINWLMYSGYFGLILGSYLLYLFLTRMELFLIISFILESFSIIS